MGTATPAAVCRAFYPGDRIDGVLCCGRCRVDMAYHPPFGDLSLYEVGVEIQKLLTHYGHDCTVQNLLPALTRALAREYGR